MQGDFPSQRKLPNWPTFRHDERTGCPSTLGFYFASGLAGVPQIVLSSCIPDGVSRHKRLSTL